MQKRYVIGIDFGTLSGRCVLLDGRSGKQVAETVCEYPHGVMSERMPNGAKLPPRYALQDPRDYLEVLRATIPDALRQAGVSPAEVAGLGIDVTACTLLPVDERGTPLSFDERYANDPHAYIKLWKHHGAQPQADRVNALAAERREPWLARYGGKISCEWALPKILEVLEESPAIFAAAHRFTEAADWLSLVLTGVETHSAPFAGYKALWSAEDGFPSDDFFKTLHPALGGIVGTKICDKVTPLTEKIAGTLNANGASLTGLLPGTPVALPLLDAHASLPALGVTGEGEMVMIVGTSGVLMLNGKDRRDLPGICGYVKDGVIPGYYLYEAGQAAVGDIFDWYVSGHVPAAYTDEAARSGVGIHQLLCEKAEKLAPGESGLLALDWQNGNRSVLMDADLSGMVLGLTLGTKPEELYRAWIEATAYGARMIIENFGQNGIPVERIVVSGGIAKKNPMMMQIYADVLGRDLHVSACTQSGALGSAAFAAVAGGLYPDIREAARVFAAPVLRTYKPDAARHAAYERLYAEYKTLHDYFGRGGNDVMKRLPTVSAPTHSK